MKKRGLGRGLDALLKSQTAPAVAVAVDGATRAVAVADLRPGKFQPRGGFDDDALRELAASIRARGVLQPIIARALPAGELEIVAGERRWRAAKIAGLESVPCLVRAIDDDEALSCALIENLQREDLNPLEIAEGLRRLVSRFGLTQEQAAAGLGMSRPAAANLLRLLALAAPVKKMLAAGEIEMGHARALLPLPPAAQEAAARKIAAQKLTVRATENLVRQMTRPDSATARPPAPDPDTRRLEESLSVKLGARVTVAHGKGGGGKLIIRYRSLDALDAIARRLGRRGDE